MITALTVLAGAGGGALRTILGYAQNDEPFSYTKFIKSLVRASIGGFVLTYGLNLDPTATFFAAFSSDVIMKEAWSYMQPEKKIDIVPTLPVEPSPTSPNGGN